MPRSRSLVAIRRTSALHEFNFRGAQNVADQGRKIAKDLQKKPLGSSKEELPAVNATDLQKRHHVSSDEEVSHEGEGGTFSLELLPSFKHDLDLLVDMGIDRALAEWSLVRHGGDVAAAADTASGSEGAAAFANEQAHLAAAKDMMASAEVAFHGYEAANAQQRRDRRSKDRRSSHLFTDFAYSTSSRPPAHLTDAELQALAEGEILGRWQESGRDLHAALLEYQPAADRICVAPEFMNMSRLGRCLRFLEKSMKSQDAGLAIEAIVLAMIKKAYHVCLDEVACLLRAEVPGLESGNMFEGAMQCYSALTWEKPYFKEALRLLLESEDSEGLKMVLGMMRTGANWCNARKLYMFSNIVTRVAFPVVACLEKSSGKQQASSSVTTAKRAVFEITYEFMDDMKDQAFKTTFYEPTKMCFRGNDEVVKENNVDMHGANTYLAVMAATLGVQFNRRPCLDDIVVGCVDFLEYDSAPPAWADAHFGRDWETVADLRLQLGSRAERPKQANVLQVLGFFASYLWYTGFVFEGRKVKEVANAAVDPDGPRDRRLHLAKYLEKFAYWFSEDFIVPRIISRLTGETGRLEAMQVLMDDLLARNPTLAGEEGEEDVRFWLWDMGQFPAVLRIPRAVRLLRHIGILRKTQRGRSSLCVPQEKAAEHPDI